MGSKKDYKKLPVGEQFKKDIIQCLCTCINTCWIPVQKSHNLLGGEGGYLVGRKKDYIICLTDPNLHLPIVNLWFSRKIWYPKRKAYHSLIIHSLSFGDILDIVCPPIQVTDAITQIHSIQRQLVPKAFYFASREQWLQWFFRDGLKKKIDGNFPLRVRTPQPAP